MFVVICLRPVSMTLILGAGWFVSPLAVRASESNAPAILVTASVPVPTATTNDPPPWLKNPVLSPPQLRRLNGETVATVTSPARPDNPDLDLKVPVKIAPPPRPRTALVLDPGAVSVTTDCGAATGGFNPQLERQARIRGLLRIPSHQSDNAVVRALDHTFSPAVIHYRKADMSCTLFTAFKRKNAFCLLNPIFFNVSW